MYLLKLCETCIYPPRLIEHWLCTIQKCTRPVEILLLENHGKIIILCSEDLSPHLPGSSCTKSTITSGSEIIKKLTRTERGACTARDALGKILRSIPGKNRIFLQQKKGPLLPIKRHGQFEDRINKERIFPMDNLLKSMTAHPNSFVSFNATPVHGEYRRRALKKAKRAHFQPERLLDQWESRSWIQSRLVPSGRRIFGPLIRRILTHLQKEENVRLTPGAQEKTESTHEREDPKAAVLDKLSRPLFKVEIQASPILINALENFANGFSIPYLGELSLVSTTSSRTDRKNQLILSAEEFASIIAPPHPKNSAPYLLTESTAHLPAPKLENTTDPMQISDKDRQRHLYAVGKTGMGKSTALLHLFSQDAKSEKSILLLDPHGDLIEDATARIPQYRHKDTIIIDPSQTEFPLAINPLQLQANENASLKASALLEIFQALAKGSWGPRLEYILRNSLLALTLAPNTTLLDIPHLLTNEKFCRRILATNTICQTSPDPELQRFFLEEFFKQDPKNRQEHIAPILNKVGPLLSSTLLRNIFGQPREKFDLTCALSSNKIVLINLSKGKLGEDTSRMLGMIFISMLQSMLLRRANLPQNARNPVAVFIDEFQSFATPTLISMLSESRKYGLALTLANQYLTQLPPEIQDAVLGNVGSMLAFRLSYQDAQILAPSLGLTEEDLTNLAPFQTYAKLLKDARPLPLFRWDIPKPPPQPPSPPRTIQPLVEQDPSQKILRRSLHRYGNHRSFVEEKIRDRYNASK